MKTIDAANCNLLHTDATNAMKEVAMKHELVIQPSTARYEINGMSCSITYKFQTKDFDKLSWEEAVRYIPGLEPEDFGKQFNYGRKRFQIMGWRDRSRTKQIRIQNVDTGSQHKVDVDVVVRELAKEKENEVA